MPQAPQLAGSLATSVQAPPHAVLPPAQPHFPPEHAWPAAHATAHAPQFLESLERSTQAPWQALSPEEQLELQTPLEHT
ncbi:MAG TPA: hypothetical protein VFQ35_05855 [Polyangiaceae bacterium]|nr:hypothetical protein [Polyangiaceae bacterium]